MLASRSKPIVDFYPIVVNLDDETLTHGTSNNPNIATNASLYDTVASEASWFASERSWRLDEDNIETEMKLEENAHSEDGSSWHRRRLKIGSGFSPSSPRRKRSHGPSRRRDCDHEWNGNRLQHSKHNDDDDDDGESTSSGGVLANLRSLLNIGSHRHNTQKHKYDDSAPEEIHFSKASPQEESPIRVVTKRNRPRRFHDNYVLTQQIARCRSSTLWECVHRPTGRRYCVKAIDKRRLTSQSDRAMAVREITMHRFIHQFSPASCLPIIRDIFADGEAAETAEDDDCKSIASCCSGSTKSVSSHSAYDDSHHNNHWHIVQDFEAGGGNLELYLLDRENLIFEMTENGGSNSEGNQNKNNNFRALSDASRATSNIMQESEVRSLARALVQALYQLHRRSICHNDLCPENILIPVSPTTRHRDNEPDPNNSENEEFRSYSYLHNRHRRRQSHDASSGDFFEDLKLCDLGRAFVVDESAANATTDGDPTDCNIPRHSSIYFTSPEVLLGKHPGLASDMWSVGVILYRCFAGELPFRERSDDGTSIPHSTVSGYASSSSTSMDSKLRQQLKRDICRAHCNFGRSSRNKIIDLRWSRVTRGAKQFLSALLNPVPSVRLTCEEAFHHPWLMNSATGMGAVWGMSESSFSPPLTMTPIVPSKTLTNHYHHHPRYSTTRTIEMNQGNHFHSQHERTADVEPTSFRTLPSSALYVSESRPSDELNSSPGRRPKSFVHKLLGRLKSSSGNNKSHHRSKTL